APWAAGAGPSEASGTGDRPRRLGGAGRAVTPPRARAAEPAGVPRPGRGERSAVIVGSGNGRVQPGSAAQVSLLPKKLLSPSETRRGLAAAFRMWSDVSPFSFREVAQQPSDLRIGCLDRLFVCASWARRGFCDARQRLMKRLCPSSCDFCYEFPFPTVAATAPPPRTKTRLVPEGRNVTFRCGQKILHKKGKVYWYKDQEPLEFSYPGYLALGEAHLSIIANAVNEGTYTCVVRRRQRVLSTYSWRVRVRS
ncbi:Matrix metalloproteinase-23, partial [Camelus dromedarius]